MKKRCVIIISFPQALRGKATVRLERTKSAYSPAVAVGMYRCRTREASTSRQGPSSPSAATSFPDEPVF